MSNPDKSIACHRTFGSPEVRSCFHMVTEHNCQLWRVIMGRDPQTGAVINHSACLDTMGHMLQIENSKLLSEVGAETHELRNDIAAAQGRARTAAMGARWAKVAAAMAPPPAETQLIE